MIRDSLMCPRQLMQDEIDALDFDELSVEEIRHLINCGVISESNVVAYYNNEWWDHSGDATYRYAKEDK